MGRIIHKPKKASPQHSQITELIATILATSNDELPNFLTSIDSWKWPRSDLNAWVKVLDRFDAILEEDVIRAYGIDNIQMKPFSPHTKATVCEILRFERLLLENSTNRKMFNSYDRLNSLLFTSDLDVLVLTLFLLLRPSQQYSSQNFVIESLGLSTSRLESLLKPWLGVREHGIDLLELASENETNKVAELTAEASEVSYSFYRRPSTQNSENKDKDSKMELAEEASSSQTHSVQPGLVNIHLESLATSSSDVMEILQDAIETYSVPDEHKYELMCRIRVAWSLGRERLEERRKLVIIRLLSIAIWIHTHNDGRSQSSTQLNSLFVYESDLAMHIAELLQLERGVPPVVQTAAIAALDGLVRIRSRMQEVLAVINAGVNHGILMSLLRKTVTDLSNEEIDIPQLFIDALLSFVIYVASHAAGGNMLVGAGLIPLLIQLIENKLPQRLNVVSKAMQLFDNALYGYANAFQVFCHSHGVEALTDRIQFEVNYDIENFGNGEDHSQPAGAYGSLPVMRTALLKHVLRSMHRMMQSSGTTEGLRGLIDSSLLKSVKKIIEYRGLLGPTILPIAINIMATFVHNEPTSLSIIQEVGLSELFYRTIELGIEPSIECIQAVLNAIGALCLNQAGQDQLAARPTIIPGLMAIFVSDKHLKILQEKENAASIGGSLDELIRHHPTLKTSVFESIISVLSVIEEMGKRFTPNDDTRHWYTLSLPPIASSSFDGDIAMSDASASRSTQENTVAAREESDSDEPQGKAPENTVVSYMNVICKCLEGLFQNVTHCRDFIHMTDGLSSLVRLTTLPCLTYDFPDQAHANGDFLIHVLQSMTEVAPSEVLVHMVTQIKQTYDSASEFWQANLGDSRFLQFLDSSDAHTLSNASRIFRQMVILYIQICIFQHICEGYHSRSRGPSGLFAILTASDRPAIISELGTVHRVCIWENIMLKAGLSAKGIGSTADSDAAAAPATNDANAVSMTDNSIDNLLSLLTRQQTSARTDSTPPRTPQERTAAAFRYILTEIPKTLAVFFRGLTRLFMVSRRSSDATQKKPMVVMASNFASVMLKHLDVGFCSDDKLSLYAYCTSMLNIINDLLFDERGNLHVLILIHFRRLNGLDAVLQNCRRYSDAISRINDSGHDFSSQTVEENQELIHVYGGLRIAVQLLYQLVSYKPSLDSAQILQLFIPEKAETSPDFYEPHDFLVKLRLCIVSYIAELWEAPWLVSSPPGVITLIVQALLEIMSGDNEESRGSTSMDTGPSAGPAFLRPSRPDEDRIRQLTDMGFPRAAVVRALTRSNNNVTVATEFLLAAPFPLIAEVEAEADQQDAQEDHLHEDTHEDTSSSPVEENLEQVMPISTDDGTVNEGTVAERRQELNLAREKLKPSIGLLALRLLDAHPSLIFAMRQAFIGPPDSFQSQAVGILVEDIKRFSPSAHDMHEEPLAVRCRLLALVLLELPFDTFQATAGSEQALMDSLLALLLSSPINAEKDQATPKWLPALLLVVESMLSQSERPRAINLPLSNEAVPEELIYSGPSYSESRGIIFDYCLRLLQVSTLPYDDFLAILRLLVLLTRDSKYSREFVQRNGLSQLFQHHRYLPAEAKIAGGPLYFSLVLRHLIEDKATLKVIMQQNIKKLLGQPRTRVMEMTNYMRNCGQMAIRDFEVFIDATKSLCYLLQPDTPSNNISLKQTVEDDQSNARDIDEDTQDRPDLHTTNRDELEFVMHFIIGELFRVGKAVTEGSNSKQASSSIEKTETRETAPTTASPSTQESKDVAKDDSEFAYVCLLLQCLTELLSSYDTCKSAFLSYSKKKGQTPTKEGASKHKTVALNLLLSDFITLGAFATEPNADSQKKIALCRLAIAVVVALCVDSPSSEMKNNPVDLSGIRKVALEALSRFIKEATAIDSVDIRFGKLLALTDLCNSLLTVKFNASKPQEETSIKIAKIMLEKNYVATLTGILSDVDLAYPNMLKFFDAVLRPLEQLTKIAIKMGRAMDKTKDIPDKESDSHTSSDSEMDDELEAPPEGVREMTPDLYRNSSLGMYSGEMDDASYAPEDDMDEDEDEEDIDMEYDDTASDDSSNTDEEVVDDDVLGVAADPSGDAWQDVDEEMDDEDGSTDDNSDEEQDAEGDGDEEILWQDVTDADGITPDGLVDEVDDEEEIAIPILDENEERDDEADRLSEEDLAEELDTLEAHEHRFRGGDDPFGLGRQILRGMGLREERILFSGNPITGRGRIETGPGMHIFGRSRSITSPDAAIHPLLTEANSSASSSVQPARGHLRRLQRSLFNAGSVTDLMQTIDDFIGGGARDLLQQALSAGPAGADIHVQIPAFGEHGHLHRRLPIPTAVRVESQLVDGVGQRLDFSPFSTSERWMEEARMIHAKHLNERLNLLSNHVTLALLPEARVAAEKAKEKAEKDRAIAEANRVAEDTEGTGTSSNPQEQISPQEPPVLSVEDVVESSADIEAPVPIENIQSSENVEPVNEDIEMADVPDSMNQQSAVNPDAPNNAAATQDGQEPSVEDNSVSVSTSSVQPERVTINIHGNAVDITDTGIDPTFLEALPDDMREEILNQHFREQRVAQVERPPESQISAEFLDALPPEIRAEILQQERLERTRRERAQNTERPGTVASTGPLEIDPASFIASLDPQLRQVVLLDQDDMFLQTLPSHMIAEAGILRDGSRSQPEIRRELPVPATSQPARKAAPSKDAIQLLDRSGIAALVRLLFFPQLPRKNTLHKILLNLCENAKSRTDLFSLLLNILQDGTGDLMSVDRNFAQMSVRTSKSPLQPTSKTLGKHKGTASYGSNVPPFQLTGEVPSDMIAQRSLDALNYIVGTNELSSLFFLTEHELPAALKRSSSKKGKGKEKQMTAQSYYPIVLLLGLLDRPSLLKTPSIMDSLAGLLASVTRPLTSLLQDKKDKPDPPSTSDTTAAAGTAQVQQTLTPQASTSADISAPQASSTNGVSVEALEEKILLTNPPQIPHPTLRLIVNILTIGECSGRTFQHTLALIQHLFCIPDARDIIAQELRLKAQDFGQSLSRDLDTLTLALRSEPYNEDFPTSAIAKFSPASSDQAKLLRVLKTIDYMYSSKSAKRSSDNNDSSEENTVHEIYESFHFTFLWRKLSECLAVIEEKSDVEHVATILLPLIESLMVVCKYVGSKSTPKSIISPSSPRPSAISKEWKDELFVQFTDAHRKILNLMVRNNPSLMSGSFSLLVNNPRVLDFDNKRNYFNQQLHRRPHPREHHGTLQLNVRRARVFEDSYQYLQRKTGEQIKYGKLSVRFYDEEGVDAGGVTREWFQILARQMFNPNYALFEPCAADKQTYQPNRASAVNNEHLSFFKFVGRVIGKAIYDGRLLDAYFARSLYRQLLGKPVDYRDVEWVDPEYYNSLCWILENDPSPLDLTFITEVDEFGKRDIIPLKEGGASILVTHENKKEYVQLSAQYRLYSSIKDQIESLLGGFYEIIPKDLISIFNEQEVELLISGTPDIDVDEWRAATEYNGYTSSDPVIVWWWRALKSFNRDERAKVLSFATGTSRVPLGGFVELQGVQGIQRFSIHRAYGNPDRLPQAHTCFNQIDLPQYTSYEMLRHQLLLAINEGGEGFGFA